jgi:thiol-disulfide isomerase/thioredoxin
MFCRIIKNFKKWQKIWIHRSFIVLLVVLIIENQYFINSRECNVVGKNYNNQVLGQNDLYNTKILNVRSFYKIAKVEPKKLKLIVLYASWCPACTKKMPTIIKIANKFSQSGLDTFLISLDQDHNLVEKYLKSYDSELITPIQTNLYMADSILRNNFPTILKEYGIQYRRSIPLIALIDEFGHSQTFEDLGTLTRTIRSKSL